MRSISVLTVLLGMLSLASAVSTEPEPACPASTPTQLPPDNAISSVESSVSIQTSPPVATSSSNMISSPSKSHPGRIWRQRCGWVSENAFLRGEYICYSYETTAFSSAGPRFAVPKKFLLVLATLVTMAFTSATVSTVTITEAIPVGPGTTEQPQLPSSTTVAATTVTVTMTGLPTPTTSVPPACVMRCGYVATGPFSGRKMCWCQTLEEMQMASPAPKSASLARLLLVLVALATVVLASDWIPTTMRTEATTCTETTTYTVMRPASTVTEVREASTVTETVAVTKAPTTPAEAPACQPSEEPRRESTSGAAAVGSKAPRVAMLVLSFLTAAVLGWPGERRCERPQSKPPVLTTTVEYTTTTTETQHAPIVTILREPGAGRPDSPEHEGQDQLPDFEDWILDVGKMAGDPVQDLATKTKTEIESETGKGSGDEEAQWVVDRPEGSVPLDASSGEE